MDFTIKKYKELVNILRRKGYSFLPIKEYNSFQNNKVIFLRHDVDALPKNSLEFAKFQADLGIRGSYYFRIVSGSFVANIIKEIYSLGHEVGYHYEEVGSTAQRVKGVTVENIIIKIAIENFEENLEKFRKVVPVSTICMHGTPLSRWDSRLLWKYYDYKDFGITCEPYFDINFEEVLYLTDTGRRWDGEDVSIRDKGIGYRVRSNMKIGNEGYLDKYCDWKVKPVKGSLMNMTSRSFDFQLKYRCKTTSDIILKAEEIKLPDKIIMNFHPQRWSDESISWVSELIWQNVKNKVKYFLIKMK